MKGSSSPDDNKLYHEEADAVYERLTGQVAMRSVLVTNRPLGPVLQERRSQTLDADDVEQWDYVSPGSDSAAGNMEALIVVDRRSVEQVTKAEASPS